MTFITYLKLAGMFAIPFLIVYVPILIGQYIGIQRIKKSPELQQNAIGSVVAAAFGLLAFMLAFTFQIASNRYDARKELLLEEVTNIRTAYLRAGLIPEPYRSETQKQLVEYVNIRIDLLKDPSKLGFVMSRSQQILSQLWNYTEALAMEDRSSEVYALYTTIINDLVINYNHRITMIFEYRIPAVINWVLAIIAFFSMLVLGYQFGISGKISFSVNLLLAFIFALVMFLILILDHPELGLSTVNQKPLFTLQQQLLNGFQ
jgi:hypothetical protein